MLPTTDKVIKEESKEKVDAIIDDFIEEFKSKYYEEPDIKEISQLSSEELEAIVKVKIQYKNI